MASEEQAVPTHNIGDTLIIANPTAHSGRGEVAAIFATRFFSSFHSATNSCAICLTEGTGDGARMAADAAEYDTVIALGGDGVIHEVVNGLMTIPRDDRPRLGIIPMGSGNDFARTLGMTRNDPERSIAEILQGEERSIDLGKANDTYFVETVSFGLDAAIALDTTGRRENDTMQSGSILYVTSGLRLITTNLKGWQYTATIDGEQSSGSAVLFAVQNGRTYGGGFRICPDAMPNDGCLDLCYTVAKPTLAHSLVLFGRARFGRHTHSKKLCLKKVRHVEIEFPGDEMPLCQIDGEVLVAPRYTIDIVPTALDVIVPAGCSW